MIKNLSQNANFRCFFKLTLSYFRRKIRIIFKKKIINNTQVMSIILWINNLTTDQIVS